MAVYQIGLRRALRKADSTHIHSVLSGIAVPSSGLSSSTAELWFQEYFRRENAERQGEPGPRVSGIDEHFFSRKDGEITGLPFAMSIGTLTARGPG